MPVIQQCLIDGCWKPRGTAKALCPMHYARMRNHGSPDDPREKWRERFLERIEPQESGCWHWTGTLLDHGYGQMCVRGKARAAHRVSWEFFNEREIPADLYVLHECDNPTCVNPDHLRLGTARDNSEDMVKKQRQMRGERVNTCVLTPDDVRAIRARYRRYSRDNSSTVLAREFGVAPSNIVAIVGGQTWKHL